MIPVLVVLVHFAQFGSLNLPVWLGYCLESLFGVCPLLLISGLIVGINQRKRPLGPYSIALSMLGLILFAAVIGVTLLAPVSEHA